jgi:NAD dependent epimerase/dehydratase family enzyme
VCRRLSRDLTAEGIGGILMKMRDIKINDMIGILAETWKIFHDKNEGIEVFINLCNKPIREENSRRNVKRHLCVPKARKNEMIIAVVEGFLYYV